MKKTCYKNLKICAVICEYNPFHNGHRYQLEQIRQKSGCDGILCLMSGNYTQRGEGAIVDKFTRAKAALQNGADMVLELPLPYAIGNAETFARGGVKILSAIPAVTTIAFGHESGVKADFWRVAEFLQNEPAEFKQAMKEKLEGGMSVAKAKAQALHATMPEIEENFFLSPNNILGIEYTKAVISEGSRLDILPIKRVGSGHGCAVLSENYSSASSIRKGILSGEDVGGNIPEEMQIALPLCLDQGGYARLDAMETYALLLNSAEYMRTLPDCTEGLENALKKATTRCFTAQEIIEQVTSARYPSARLRRILLSNLLGVQKKEYAPFIRPLAVKGKEWLSVLSESPLPLLVRKGDELILGEEGQLYERADRIYNAVCQRCINPFATLWE